MIIYMADSDNSNMVAVVALIVLVIVAALFFVYGLPALQNMGDEPPAQDINLTIPSPTPAPEPAE